MPPSHFVDLRLVKTNLDEEGLKFQLEEHAVAKILDVWGLLSLSVSVWVSLVQKHEMNKEERFQPQLFVGFTCL